MSERIKALEKELELAKREAKQIDRSNKIEDLKKQVGLVYYNATVSPRGTHFNLEYFKSIDVDDQDRIILKIEVIACSVSSINCNITYSKTYDNYDLFGPRFYGRYMIGVPTVSIDVFKLMKHRVKTSTKSFMEIMKALTDLKIPTIVAFDGMSEEHQKFEVDFPHIDLDRTMGFLDHTPFTIGNKYLLTQKSVEFAYAKIRDYRQKDAACSGLYESCDSSYLQRMYEVISSIDRQLLNFTVGMVRP